MTTNQQTPAFDSSSGGFLEHDMASLLQMTNDLVMKIKQQTKEISQ
jgi:hypothetical protein